MASRRERHAEEAGEESRRSRSSRQKVGETMEASGGELASPDLLPGDPSALLANPQMAHPANAPRRGQAVTELQRRRGNAYVQQVVRRVQAERGSGRPLDRGTRAPMEAAFGQDFGPMRVHADQTADDLTTGLRARAFTVGRDMFFGQGSYAPSSREGKGLLAHELAHAVQQGVPSGTASLEENGPGGGASDPLEREADTVAASVLSGKTVFVGARQQAPPLQFLISAGHEYFVRQAEEEAGIGRYIETPGFPGDNPTYLRDFPNGVPYGYVAAMPDFFATPDAFYRADPQVIYNLCILVRREISGEQITSLAWERATRGTYLALAEQNYPHFLQGGDVPGAKERQLGSREQYTEYHRQALDTASTGRNPGDRQRALAQNAFADHFLEDSFTAAHMFSRAQLTNYLLTGRGLEAPVYTNLKYVALTVFVEFKTMTAGLVGDDALAAGIGRAVHNLYDGAGVQITLGDVTYAPIEEAAHQKASEALRRVLNTALLASNEELQAAIGQTREELPDPASYRALQYIPTQEDVTLPDITPQQLRDAVWYVVIHELLGDAIWALLWRWIGQPIEERVAELMRTARSWIEGAISWGQERWRDIRSMAEGAWSTVTSTAGQVARWIVDNARRTGEAVSGAIGGMWQFVQEKVSEVRELAGGAWTDLRDSAGEVWRQIGSTVEAGRDWLTEQWEGVTESASQAATGVGEWVTEGWAEAREAAGAVRGWASDRWTDITESVSEGVETLGDTLGNVWESASSAVGGLFGHSS